MLSEVIEYLNTKISTTNFFNEILCLAEKIEREDKVYPAIYNGGGEYVNINLDANGSLCYWRKSGDVKISDEENNSSSCGIQYKTTVPLKLIGFIKKDIANNTSTFTDKICQQLIGTITTNTSVMKTALKAKRATIVANGYSTDIKKVLNDEYDKVDFEVYKHRQVQLH